MKKTILKTLALLPIFASSLFLFQCAGTSHVTLSVVKPATVDMPNTVKNIVLLDRTERPDKDVAMVQSILQAQDLDTDKEGARLCLNGLADRLNDNGSYGVKRVLERMKGSALLEGYPPLLTWPEVQKICSANNSDTLISLEMFQSTFIVTKGTVTPGLEGKLPTLSYSGKATIKAGFRIYNPATKSLIDEYHFTDTKTYNKSSSSVIETLSGLFDKNQAVGDIGYAMGDVYGARITPSWYNVTRELYTTPTKYMEMKKGTRLSQVADWNGAIEAWKAMVEKATKEDHAGRAAYNVAVSYEVLGDLTQARAWAVKSFTEYGLKKSKDYVDRLDRRIYDEQQAKEQAKK